MGLRGGILARAGLFGTKRGAKKRCIKIPTNWNWNKNKRQKIPLLDPRPQRYTPIANTQQKISDTNFFGILIHLFFPRVSCRKVPLWQGSLPEAPRIFRRFFFVSIFIFWYFNTPIFRPVFRGDKSCAGEILPPKTPELSRGGGPEGC